MRKQPRTFSRLDVPFPESWKRRQLKIEGQAILVDPIAGFK
jgi:hypothetical protein